MSILSGLWSRRILVLAYLLFIVSMLLPTFAIDLGNNGNPVQPGYRVFLGGSVAAIGIILEPGGELGNRFLGIYYFVTWLANAALLLPFLTVVPQSIRQLLAGLFVLLAWSILCSYYLIDNNLISEIGIGYFLWSLSITLIPVYLAARKPDRARMADREHGNDEQR